MPPKRRGVRQAKQASLRLLLDQGLARIRVSEEIDARAKRVSARTGAAAVGYKFSRPWVPPAPRPAQPKAPVTWMAYQAWQKLSQAWAAREAWRSSYNYNSVVRK